MGRRWGWIGHILRKSVASTMTSIVLEPPGEKEKRQGKKHLVPKSPGRHAEDSDHLELIRCKGTG